MNDLKTPEVTPEAIVGAAIDIYSKADTAHISRAQELIAGSVINALTKPEELKGAYLDGVTNEILSATVDARSLARIAMLEDKAEDHSRNRIKRFIDRFEGFLARNIFDRNPTVKDRNNINAVRAVGRIHTPSPASSLRKTRIDFPINNSTYTDN